MSLATAWARALGIQFPIVNAPMGGAAGGRLAAAVSRAGGLGMIGMGSSGSAAQLRTELRHVDDLEQPFGIGLIDWATRTDPHLLDTAITAHPALLTISFGDSYDWVRRAHDAGIRTATQVATADQAETAANAGIDVIVARGSEGGGHGHPAVGTLPLLTTILDRVEVPVLAAGGIASARGLAAVLAAGAAGAWIGTLFAACTEALTSDHARHALLRATETDTVTTSKFDRAHGYPWPPQFPERVLRHHPATRTADHTTEPSPTGDDPTPVNAGQGVAMITRPQPAHHVITQLVAETTTLLSRWAPPTTARMPSG